jgi:hypothetical protein
MYSPRNRRSAARAGTSRARIAAAEMKLLPWKQDSSIPEYKNINSGRSKFHKETQKIFLKNKKRKHFRESK